MTQIDFYILPDAGPDAKAQFACRLAEKVYRLQHKIYIHTTSEEQAGELDRLLWTYSAGSFLPHEQYLPEKPADAPILIGCRDEPPADVEVLFNLADEVPLFFSRFKRVTELVDNNETTRQQDRERFRFYKDRGYPIASHHIQAKR